MSRISLRPVEELDDELRAMVAKWEAGGGDPNFVRAFAHAPEFLKKFVAFYSPLVRKGRVEHRPTRAEDFPQD